jgi:hypothetical protein
MIFLLFVLILFWELIYSILLSVFIEHKIANNIRGFINNLLFILYYNILPNVAIIYIPLSSYIFDTYLIYKNSKTIKSFIKEPMTIHHIISIIAGLYIINDHLRYEIFAIYYITYLSNIFIFVSYHFIKTMPTYKLLNNVILIIQMLVYCYYRIYILSTYLYDEYDKILLLSLHDAVFIGLIYIMGIVWSCKLLYKTSKLCYKLLNKMDHTRLVGE